MLHEPLHAGQLKQQITAPIVQPLQRLRSLVCGCQHRHHAAWHRYVNIQQRNESGLVLCGQVKYVVATRAAGESNTARPESSNPLFFDGLRALETHQYAKAKQLFERLYRGSAAPEVLYQLGRVAQGEGKDVLAADLFRRYRELLGGQRAQSYSSMCRRLSNKAARSRVCS